MADGTEVEIGSQNVFADLSLPNAAALYLKAQLMVALKTRLQAQGGSAEEAAQQYHLAPDRVVALMQDRFKDFELEELVCMADRLGLQVVLREPAAAS